MASEVYNQFIKEGIESLIKIPEEYKIWSAIHMLPGYELNVNFLMLETNFLLGIDQNKGRLYTGKIGERDRNNCDLSLYYMDIHHLDNTISEASEIEFSEPTLYQDKLYFPDEMPPIFFSPCGSNSKEGLSLPRSNGSLYQDIETTNIHHLRNNLSRYIYTIIGESLKRDPQMFLIMKAIEDCCKSSGCAYTKKDVLKIYERYRLQFGEKSAARRLRLK